MITIKYSLNKNKNNLLFTFALMQLLYWLVNLPNVIPRNICSCNYFALQLFEYWISVLSIRISILTKPLKTAPSVFAGNSTCQSGCDHHVIWYKIRYKTFFICFRNRLIKLSNHKLILFLQYNDCLVNSMILVYLL